MFMTASIKQMCPLYFFCYKKLHNTEEFIKQGGVWKKEVSGKSEDVPGLVDNSVLH